MSQPQNQSYKTVNAIRRLCTGLSLSPSARSWVDIWIQEVVQALSRTRQQFNNFQLLWLQITARMSIDQCFIRQLLGQTASCGFADFFVLTGLHPHVFGTNATHWTSFCESIELCAVARLARGSPAPPGPSPRVDVVSIGTALFTRRRVSGAQAPGRDRQACGIKAIRWAYRTLQVDCLMVSLGLVISSFQKTNSGERREVFSFHCMHSCALSVGSS